MKRRYDANAMLEKIEDMTMPLLLKEIARAEGCPRVDNRGDDRCMLHYDLGFVAMFKNR
ncbi:hypothetical protein JJB09_18650 [Rhizobium sp. KVB221]|uniref:Uncharacterized protein n=1 Tax=Rhizobium setariae TaxID=2801340 RepID=A0A937CM93_9HYPH|nr:hypothetical protein [Rhizobium setariae]MBL0374045.1 hypothetical protein [Rhizobium setariae]